MRVLIVEDDQQLATLIARALKREGITADLAHDGQTGLEMALGGAYDVAVVDWMLPGRDGPAICLAVRRARRPLPILMLTARGQIEDRVQGLDSGADDYLVKPFAIEELLARLRALSRRYDIASPDGAELRCGDLRMNLIERRVYRGDVPIDLTLTEWELLEYLMRNCDRPLSREQIFNRVWAMDSDAQLKMVDIYISYLRRKLKTAAGLPDPIETVRGVGYRLISC
ncbi:MAG: DNA-binding response regulator [Chloroflexi bacterium]|jgi:DNA-binding response OmpR family regulator|uniref:DNA-binding response regulator n=1 Tax=Candidatus Thermofonsia Clade 3 bacterium TaxID=2364212 RepID=A0A2M8QBS5_9CHLR|nr:response regulator transcription factor [Candidatus Roseilinea sp. NK_OTU-006]PJF47246.1 MAG: DNA-binding response regulator [Candidatus Thermofonsia Clade 3 bacterium]RMG64060.1 MAG: DNA-binding response regulator [Chloroflexota bacterium]